MDWSSFDCIKKVRNSLKFRFNIKEKIKIGHTGVLDPKAEGLLLIGFGEASKFFKFLPDRKIYKATGILGKISTTYDTEGEIKETKIPIKDFDEDDFKKLLNKNFLGKIKQRPPIHSNIKIDGKRSYEMARQGKDFEIPERVKEIYDIKLIKFDAPNFEIEVSCESGTYIRSIIHDIGAISKFGAYTTSITRTGIGSFSKENIKIVYYNNDLKEFEIHDNIMDLEEMFNNNFFKARINIDSKYKKELMIKGNLQIDLGKKNIEKSPIYIESEFIGFGNYNSKSNSLQSLRLISQI